MEGEGGARWLGLRLAPGADGGNVVAMLLHSFSTVLLLAFMNAMQAFLLKDVYNVPPEELGRTTAVLAIADEVWSFVWLGLWGIISDRAGRRWVCALGYASCALSLFLMPHGGTVLPGLLLIRLIFAQGAAALLSMLTALLADFVAPDSLGIGSGLLGLSSGLGAVVSVFVFVGALPVRICITNTYYVAGSVPLAMVGVAYFKMGLKHATAEADTKPSGTSRAGSELKAMLALGKEATLQMCKRPRLGVAYLSGINARAGSVLVTVFISLWVTTYFEENQLCGEGEGNATESTCGEVLTNSEKASCAEAFTASSVVGGLTQTVALVAALFVGWLSSRKGTDPMRGLAVFAACGVLAYASVLLVESPVASGVYVSAVLWGLTEIAVIVYAQVVISAEMKLVPHMAGTIAGVYSMCGSLGVLYVSSLGGFLFDVWRPEAPFILMCISSAVLAVSAACSLHSCCGERIGPDQAPRGAPESAGPRESDHGAVREDGELEKI